MSEGLAVTMEVEVDVAFWAICSTSARGSRLKSEIFLFK